MPRYRQLRLLSVLFTASYDNRNDRKIYYTVPIIVTLTLTSSLLEALWVLPVHLHEMKNVYNSQKKPEKKWYKKF